LTVLEDSGLTPLGLGSLSYGTGGGADESGQNLTYRVTAVPTTAGRVVLSDGSTVVTVGGTYSLDDIRGMKFRTAPNAHAGPESFSFTVRDDGGTANGGADTLTESMTITVTAVNDDPDARNDAAATHQDRTLVINAAALLVNDTDVDGDGLDVDSFTQPANGVVVDNGDGTLTYQPRAGFIGVDSFTYTVSDGNGGSDTATVAVTVNGLKLPPPPPPVLEERPGDTPTDDPADTGDDEDHEEDDKPVAEVPPPQSPVIPDASERYERTTTFDQHDANPAIAAYEAISAGHATTDVAFDPIAPISLLRETQLGSAAKAAVQVATTALLPSNLNFIYDAAGFLGDLDSFKDSLSYEFSIPNWAAGSVVFTTAGLSVGYIIWTIRSGYLVASVLSSLPAWALVDPLPVLEYLDESEESPKRQKQEDNESLASILENTAKR
jgi:hypothetical protein